MPRPKRNFVNRGCYHITHRCHGGNYLFKFARHRQLYFEVLREMVNRFAIDVLNYIVTSNHTHLLLWARRGDEVSRVAKGVSGKRGRTP